MTIVGDDKKTTAFIETTVSVLSWNIFWRYDQWEARAPLIEAELAALDADIVALQEVWRDGAACQADGLANRLGYERAYHQMTVRQGVDFGLAVLSRWPIRRSEAVSLPTAPGDDRAAMVADIDGPRGTVAVFCTHLTWRFADSAVRQKQVRALAEFVAAKSTDGFPPVVCGDFNAAPTTDEVRMMTGEAAVPVEGLAFFDAWQVAGEGPGLTWSNDNPIAAQALEHGRRIDYVFVGPPRQDGGGHVVGARVIGTGTRDGLPPSDHYGVLATLQY